MARLQPGSKIGRWQVTGFIGQGDIAEVYEAKDPAGYLAAVKLFTLDVSQAQTSWQSFERESRSFAEGTAGVAASVYEFGIEPQLRRPYMVRERITLVSLHDEVTRLGPMAAPRVAAILLALAPTLDAAHAKGLVHRGFKPQNLFAAPAAFSESVQVRFADSSTHILRGAVPSPPGWAGSPGWHSPDAVDAKTASGARMDIYALGLVCFFALTGRPVFKALGRSPVDFDALWNEIIQPVDAASQRARELGATLGSALDPWFLQAIAPHPRARFATVSDMATQFASRMGAPAARTSEPQPSAQAAPAAHAGSSRSTQMGLGDQRLAFGGTLVLEGAKAPSSTASTSDASGTSAGTPQQPRRAFGGTLIMDYSAKPPPVDDSVAPEAAHDAGSAAQPGASAEGQSSEAIRPATDMMSTEGPVALASGQPLAFMRELPRSVPAQAGSPVQSASLRNADTTAKRPSKNVWLVPLLLFGAVAAIAIVGFVGWTIYARSHAGNEAAGSSASAIASTAPAPLPVQNRNPEPEAPAPTPPPTDSAAAVSPPVEPTIEPAESDALITFKCMPECDAIECDGKQIELDDEAVRLSPGNHVCTGRKAGFNPKKVSLTVRAGQKEIRTLPLSEVREPATTKPRPGVAKKKPCGTFINPCQ